MPQWMFKFHTAHVYAWMLLTQAKTRFTVWVSEKGLNTKSLQFRLTTTGISENCKISSWAPIRAMVLLAKSHKQRKSNCEIKWTFSVPVWVSQVLIVYSLLEVKVHFLVFGVQMSYWTIHLDNSVKYNRWKVNELFGSPQHWVSPVCKFIFAQCIISILLFLKEHFSF